MTTMTDEQRRRVFVKGARWKFLKPYVAIKVGDVLTLDDCRGGDYWNASNSAHGSGWVIDEPALIANAYPIVATEPVKLTDAERRAYLRPGARWRYRTGVLNGETRTLLALEGGKSWRFECGLHASQDFLLEFADPIPDEPSVERVTVTTVDSDSQVTVSPDLGYIPSGVTPYRRADQPMPRCAMGVELQYDPDAHGHGFVTPEPYALGKSDDTQYDGAGRVPIDRRIAAVHVAQDAWRLPQDATKRRAAIDRMVRESGSQ